MSGRVSKCLRKVPQGSPHRYTYVVNRPRAVLDPGRRSRLRAAEIKRTVLCSIIGVKQVDGEYGVVQASSVGTRKVHREVSVLADLSSDILQACSRESNLRAIESCVARKTSRIWNQRIQPRHVRRVDSKTSHTSL